MRTQDVKQGITVKTPNGTTAVVSGVRIHKTGNKGRPTTYFVVGDTEYRARDLKAAQ
jgi:hypothetical protein